MRAVLLGLVLLLAQGRAGQSTASLAGQVVDADSRAPIAEARVIAVNAGGQEEVTTDRRGRFRFERLVPGQYGIQAEKAGFVANRAAAFAVVTLTGAAEGLVLPLYRSGVLAGNVVDDRGMPLARVAVHALRKDGQPGMPGLQGPLVLTTDLGEFRIASLMAGEYVVLAVPPPDSASRGLALSPTYYPTAPDPGSAFTVTLDPGQTVFNLYITLLASTAYEIAGRVVDDQGRARGDAMVRIVVQETRGRASFQATARAVSTARDGTFRIGGLPSGRYRLTAIAGAPPGASPEARIEGAISGVISGLLRAGAAGPAVPVEILGEDVRDVRLVLPSEP